MTQGAEFNAAIDELHIIVEDAEDLTPKEVAQERKAIAEELKKRSWMADTADQLAARIPVSVFAMGQLASDD